MTLIERILMKEEGLRLSPYDDGFGNATVGYGHLLMDDEKFTYPLTDQKAKDLLDTDIAKAISAVKNHLLWIAQLNEARYSVIVCMAFQLGINGLLEFHDALAAIKAGNWEDAYEALLDSDWADQTPGRAARMADIIYTGKADYYN